MALRCTATRPRRGLEEWQPFVQDKNQRTFIFAATGPHALRPVPSNGSEPLQLAPRCLVNLERKLSGGALASSGSGF